MEVFWSKLAALCAKYWYRPITILVVVFVLFVVLAYMLASVDLKALTIGKVGIAAGACIGVFAIWLHLVRPPIPDRGKIGFVVAITGEDKAHTIQIRSDFISSLRSELEQLGPTLPVQVIELPGWHAQRIIDSDSARKYVRQCRAHFLVFGTARLRIVGKREVHALTIRQVAIHKPVPQNVSDELSREVTEIFPTRLNLDRENDLIGLEVTSRWLGYASQYFIAMAALLSGDYELSERILVKLSRSKALASLKAIPGVAKLRGLVPQRLGDLYLVRSRIAYVHWRHSRAIADVEEMNSFLEQFNKIRPGLPQYHLPKAIWSFVVHRNLPEARAHVMKCRGTSDATWRYSLAFLDAYHGRVDAAIVQYKKAFSRRINLESIFEIEEFLTWILECEPDKYQLYFLLGMLNLIAKEDPEAALRDFRCFVEGATADGSGRFRAQLPLAEGYISAYSRPI